MPDDPAGAAAGTLSQPPYYLTMTMPGQPQPRFSLLTTFTPRGRPNLAALMAVNSQPGPGYGTIRSPPAPAEHRHRGPAAGARRLRGRRHASADLSLWRQGGSTVTFGNLVTVPLGGGLLSTRAAVRVLVGGGSSGIPALKRVFAYYNGQVGYAPTLQRGQVFGPGAGGTGTGTAPARAGQRAELPPAGGDVLQPRRRPPCARNFAAFGADLAKMNAALNRRRSVAGGSAPGPGPALNGRPGTSGGPGRHDGSVTGRVTEAGRPAAARARGRR